MNDKNYPVLNNAMIEKIVMERVDFYMTQMVEDNPIFVNGPEIRVRQLANVADQFAVTLKGWLVGKKFPDRSEFDSIAYADGWWEMLKEQHAPKWFIAKWPVRYKAVRYESARFHYNICPHRAYDKEQHRHFAFIAERPDWDRKDIRNE